MSACVRCGAKTNNVLLPLKLVACRDCETAWLREESCEVATIEKAIGAPKGEAYADWSKRFAAELLKRTEAWALAWRAAA